MSDELLILGKGAEFREAGTRWLVPILFVLVAACGPTDAEKERIAQVTCAIIAETRNMDAAQRVERVNDAREELGLGPFLDGDDEIIQAIRYGVCELLVLDRGWEGELAKRQIAEAQRLVERESERQRREAERIAALRQTVAERGYAEYDEDTELRNGVTFLKGDESPFTGLVLTYHDNGKLEASQNYEDGVPHGLREAFFKDGKLRWRGNYENGGMVWSEVFDESGNLTYSSRR